MLKTVRCLVMLVMRDEEIISPKAPANWAVLFFTREEEAGNRREGQNSFSTAAIRLCCFLREKLFLGEKYSD